MIRIKCGVSGYRPDKSSYQYGVGTKVSELPEIERDLVKAGLAEWDTPLDRPIAVAPMVTNIKKAIVKRRRHV